MTSFRRWYRSLAIGLIFVSLLSSCGQRATREVVDGFKGKAKSKPFLAAERFLSSQGYVVETSTGYPEINYGWSTLIVPASSLISTGQVYELEMWIENGGHLICFLDGASRLQDDFHDRTVAEAPVYDDWAGFNQLADHIEIELAVPDLTPVYPDVSVDEANKSELENASRGAQLITVEMDMDKFEVAQWASLNVFSENSLTSGEYGETSSQDLFLSKHYGDGRITVLADARPFRNRFIKYHDHAAFLQNLIELSPYAEDGSVMISLGVDTSLWELLMKYLWMPLLGMVVVVIFWLWKNLASFGPVEDLDDSYVLEYTGQLQRFGRFLWRRKEYDALLQPLRNEFWRKSKLNAKDENLDDELVRLADSLGLQISAVRNALFQTKIRDASVMHTLISNLQNLINRI
ncbi:DUF4350 domain-containing protein [Persicirhabdus sediminis]|uniref:DUF4350 domain-containing protein n=1 Tax=Persicirhabdus sediminis TaxID=454144 RepID=A0A8J7SIG2_9BACT|nr:DUF4350 domain-containing protein [Persicirhabdus sediminis]MBK1789550.1 hypothetical protein [Persicirhabdus sediminis]